MATDKKFAVAGVSTLEGKTKIRFANDTMRIKILAKNGHQGVDLVTLPHEMTKAEIAEHLKEIGFGSGKPEVEAAIAYVAKKNPTSQTTPAAAVQETVAAV
jgi:carbamate kinase